MVNVNKKNNKGFTIVELLIVIVVIGILAAITIIAYNGIQNRAKASLYQSDTASIDKKLESYNVVNSAYPLTAAGTDAATVTAQTTAGVNLTALVNSQAESKLALNHAFFAILPIATVPTYTQAITAINASSTINSYFVAYCATGRGIRIYYPDPTSSTVKTVDAGVCP